MQPSDLQLEIASRLLSGIICQDRNRKLTDRIADIDHSLDVAAELIRRSEGNRTPSDELTLQPRPSVRTRERIVERDQVPLSELLEARRPAAPSRSSRGPTLH